jgi:cytochrome oxidase Cu insertion factor (SCO1/SenC/PrrC family)
MSRCHFCFEQTQFLTQVQLARPNLTIFSLSVDLDYDNASVLQDYLSNFSNITWRFMRDNNSVGFTQYHVQGVPTSVVIDTDGDVFSVLIGVKTTQQLLEILDEVPT